MAWPDDGGSPLAYSNQCQRVCIKAMQNCTIRRWFGGQVQTESKRDDEGRTTNTFVFVLFLFVSSKIDRVFIEGTYQTKTKNGNNDFFFLPHLHRTRNGGGFTHSHSRTKNGKGKTKTTHFMARTKLFLWLTLHSQDGKSKKIKYIDTEEKNGHSAVFFGHFPDISYQFTFLQLLEWSHFCFHSVFVYQRRTKLPVSVVEYIWRPQVKTDFHFIARKNSFYLCVDIRKLVNIRTIYDHDCQ